MNKRLGKFNFGDLSRLHSQRWLTVEFELMRSWPGRENAIYTLMGG